MKLPSKLVKQILRWVLSSSALTSASVWSITYEEAILKTINQHPRVEAKRFEYESSQQRAKGAAWQMGPSLSFQTGKNQFGQDLNTTRIQQPLFSGGRLWNSVKEARSIADSSQQKLKASEQEMLVILTDAYAEVLRYRARIENSRKNYEEHQRLYNMIVRRAETGLSSGNDVTTAEMRLQQALSDHQQNQTLEITARNQLEELIGRNIPPQETIDNLPLVSITFSYSEARELALGNSGSIASIHHDSEAAQARAKVERSALLPQVFLRHEKYNGGASTISREQTFIVVEFQLGNGFNSAYNWSAAISQQQSTFSNLKNAEKEVATNFTRDWNQVQLTQSQLPIIQKQTVASNSVMGSFLRQYTIGKKTWLDVLNAQRELSQTNYSLIDTETIYKTSRIKVAIATGLLNPSQLFSAPISQKNK